MSAADDWAPTLTDSGSWTRYVRACGCVFARVRDTPATVTLTETCEAHADDATGVLVDAQRALDAWLALVTLP